MSTLLVVTGSHAIERSIVWCALDEEKPDCVFVGDCETGTDHYTRQWCAANGVPCCVLLADWSRGKRGGPRRNTCLVQAAVLSGVKRMFAFPRGGRGTADCIRKAVAAGLEVIGF